MGKKTELDSKGEITWESFQAKLQSKEFHDMFKVLNVDPADAESLFRLVDVDGSGTVSPRELVEGWIRLKGNAKSLDLATLMQETDNYFRHIEQLLKSLCADFDML